MRITPEQFVQTWQESLSTAEVCKKLNMKPKAASVRASVYRRFGIALKLRHRGARPLDLDGLKALANRSKPASPGRSR